MNNIYRKYIKSRYHFWQAIFLIILFPLLSSCRHSGHKELSFSDTLNFELSDSLPTTAKSENASNKDNTIYYGIYSPAEVSAIFNRKHIAYDPDILSPLNHLPPMNTMAQIAIKLGIYGADFSYAHLFESADAAKYLVVVLKLSEKLGIPPEYIQNLTKRLDLNISHPDSLIQITLETFSYINHFLIDQDQENLVYLIAAGAWIEAMYIAAHDLMTDNDPDIIKKIVEQKYSLEYLLSTMKNSYLDTNVAYFYRRLFVLDKYLKKTRITFPRDNFKIDKNTKTIISTGDEICFSKDNLKKIREIIFSLRNIALND